MADQDFLTDNPTGAEPDYHPRREEPSSYRKADRTTLKVSESRGFTLREAIRLLFKHKWILLLPLIVIPPIGYFYAQSLTPIYVASARLQIQATEFAQLLPEAADVGASNRSLLNDQVLLLLSDYMLEKVVQELYLQDLMPIAGGDEMTEPEKVTAVVQTLKSRVLTVNAIPRTRSISVTAQWPNDREMPVRVANTLAEEYVDEVRNQIEQAAQKFSVTYETQAEETEQKLEEVNQEIDFFLQEHAVVSVEGRMSSLAEDLSRVRQTLWSHRNELVSIEVEIDSIEKQLTNSDPSVNEATSVVVNPEYTQAQDYLEGLMMHRMNELGRWKPDSPRIQNLDKQIEEAEQRLNEIDPQMIVEGEAVTNPAFEQLQRALPELRILKVATERKIQLWRTRRRY